MRYIALPIACIVALASCGPTQSITLATKPTATTNEDRQAVASGIGSQMKDPMSVQYMDMRSYATSGGQRIICGQYNAKNSFGAYTGFRPFYVRTLGVDALEAAAGSGEPLTDTIISTMCTQAARGKLTSVGGFI